MTGSLMLPRNSDVCVIGRTSFATGIGQMALAMYELLSRSFQTCVYPTDRAQVIGKYLQLPMGRRLPICNSHISAKATIFADVLWNGPEDFNYMVMPSEGLRLACVIFDSDQLPDEMVRVANSHFDAVIVASAHLKEVAVRSGITLPVAVLPIALDLEPLLSRPRASRLTQKIRFGSIASFHTRKGADLLITAFSQMFGNRPDVELVIHSNLGFGSICQSLQRRVDHYGILNVELSHTNLSEADCIELLDSFDVFVSLSRGEGYSIGPRQAMALGKPLVLAGVGGHLDLSGTPGVFLVPAEISVPARYPEIGNRIFGTQRACRLTDVKHALQAALDFVQSTDTDRTASLRRERAADFSYTRLATSYAEIVNTDARSFRTNPPPPGGVDLSPAFRETVVNRIGKRAEALEHVPRTVVRAYDGGFFSLFNAFFSHLVWDLADPRCHMVLPDWDVARLLGRYVGKDIMSFCYGRPEDGNIWTQLFEPLYGLTAAQMNDEQFIYKSADIPLHRHNEQREPLMTFIHAYKLYGSSWFRRWRLQYHRVFRDHIRFIPSLQREIDTFFADRLESDFIIAAHVRHPSHTAEQPDRSIATSSDYIARIRRGLALRGVQSDRFRVFLATDQEQVVEEFHSAFGKQVVYFDDARRTTKDEDKAFRKLSKEQQSRDGYQLQHLLARAPDQWSVRLAREVIRDAAIMARSNVLLHVVSNVSTAVAYMNPDIEMIFCQADPNGGYA